MVGTPQQIARLETDIAKLKTDLAATQASLVTAHAERASLFERVVVLEAALSARVQTIEEARRLDEQLIEAQRQRIATVEQSNKDQAKALALRAPAAEYVGRHLDRLEKRRRMRRSRR